MDLTDVPEGVRDEDETAPEFDEWESPESLLKGGPVRERLYDVVLQLRQPTKVSTVAERAECDTETARDYLEWFAGMGMVREHTGRPVRYERNDSYLQWRRMNHIRERYSDEEIVDMLAAVIDDIERYRDEFDAESPDEISLVTLSQEMSTEDAWEALSEWESLERRAELLDAARRGGPASGGRSATVDV